MTRLDPIFANSQENVDMERAAAEAELRHLRLMRSEADGLLEAAKDDVRMWLDSISRAIAREKAYLADRGDIDDGEIASPFKHYEGAVERFRIAQRNLERLDSQLEDQLQMLADTDLWMGGAA